MSEHRSTNLVLYKSKRIEDESMTPIKSADDESHSLSTRFFKISDEDNRSNFFVIIRENIMQTPTPAKEIPSQTKPKPKKPRKPYEEISAIFNGNEVKIRVPKSTHKPPRLTPSQVKLQQSCTCDEDASVCSETCGLVCGEPSCPSNRLDFQIPDDICESLTHRTALNSEMVYTKTLGNETLCNTCNVTPKGAPKGVQAQKVLHPDKDVFILKIGKQTDEPNRTGNIEVELVTPRAPAKPQPATHACMQIQCDEEDISCCYPCRTCERIMPKKRKCRRPPRCCY